MPKNKGKYHSKTGPDVAPAEELISFTARAVSYMRPRAGRIAAVLGGVAVVLVAFGVWSWYDRRRETDATKKFGLAAEALQARVLDPEEKPEPPVPGKEAPRTYPSAKERTEAVIKLLSEMQGGADVTQSASLLKAGLLLDLGQYDQALAEYRRFVASGAEGSLRVVAREGIGYALEGKQSLDEALKAFEQMQPDDKGFYRENALYHQARIWALKGDKAKAAALFKQVLERKPGLTMTDDINYRLALLEP